MLSHDCNWVCWNATETFLTLSWWAGFCTNHLWIRVLILAMYDKLIVLVQRIESCCRVVYSTSAPLWPISFLLLIVIPLWTKGLDWLLTVLVVLVLSPLPLNSKKPCGKVAYMHQLKSNPQVFSAPWKDPKDRVLSPEKGLLQTPYVLSKGPLGGIWWWSMAMTIIIYWAASWVFHDLRKL